MQSISRFANCVQTLSQTVASYVEKKNIEQIVSILAARVTTLETNATSVSNGSGHMVTVLQPLGPSGPMAQGHLMTAEIRGVDLMLSQAPKMNMHGVPSYYGSHVSNITLGLRIGSITFGKSQTYQPVINQSEFIARQVPYQLDSCSKQEPSVRALWPG